MNIRLPRLPRPLYLAIVPFALLVASCSHDTINQSSIDENSVVPDSTSTTEAAPLDGSLEPTIWEMECSDFTSVTINGGVAVNNAPPRSRWRYSPANNPYFEAVGILVPKPEQLLSDVLPPTLTVPTGAYGYVVEHNEVIGERGQSTGVSQTDFYVMPILTPNDRIIFREMATDPTVYPERVPGVVEAIEGIKTEGNFVTVLDVGQGGSGGLGDVAIASNDSNVPGNKLVTETMGDEKHPTRVTFELPNGVAGDANIPNTLNCFFRTLNSGQTQVPPNSPTSPEPVPSPQADTGTVTAMQLAIG